MRPKVRLTKMRPIDKPRPVLNLIPFNPMIIWKGRGILIPVFALLGLFAGGMLAGTLALVLGKEGEESPGSWVTAVTLWGAVGGLWLFAKTLGKGKQEYLIDPQTGRQVVLSTSHTLYFIPPTVWAVIGSIIALLFTVAVMVLPGGKNTPASTSNTAAAKAFKAADAKISKDSNGTAHGNTPEAVALAGKFSETAKMMRETFIQKGRKSALSLTGGEFLTYVHLTDSACVFLVHVPSLRKFTDEAKEAMGQIAWHTAQALAADLSPRRAKIAVGVRGALLYDRALLGSLTSEAAENDGIEREVKGTAAKAALEPYFEGEASPATPVVAAKPAESEPSAPAPKTAGGTPKQEPEEPAAPTPAPKEEASPAAVAASMNPEPVPAPAAPAPAPSQLPTAVRDWKSADGRPLRASLVKFTRPDRSVAEFKREDGQTFQVPVEKFSTEDQAFIRALQP